MIVCSRLLLPVCPLHSKLQQFKIIEHLYYTLVDGAKKIVRSRIAADLRINGGRFGWPFSEDWQMENISSRCPIHKINNNTNHVSLNKGGFSLYTLAHTCLKILCCDWSVFVITGKLLVYLLEWLYTRLTTLPCCWTQLNNFSCIRHKWYNHGHLIKPFWNVKVLSIKTNTRERSPI